MHIFGITDVKKKVVGITTDYKITVTIMIYSAKNYSEWENWNFLFPRDFDAREKFK